MTLATRKTLISTTAGIFGALLLAGQAAALPINVSGFAYGSVQATVAKTSNNPPQFPSLGSTTVNAGGFSAFIGASPSSTLVWCADIFNTISIPGTYTYLPAQGGGVVFGAATSNRLGVLATGALSAVTGNANNPNDSAAFQLAVWEILYEGNNPLTLGAGDFTATSAAVATANNWLAAINSGAWTANSFAVDVYLKGQTVTGQTERTQDLLTFRRVPVSEPGSFALLLMGAGLAGVIVARRRTA